MDQHGDRVTTVGVITADRPASLARTIESIVHHCIRHARRPRCLVVDGSRFRANRAATSAAVAGFAKAFGYPIDYVGPDEARRFSSAWVSRSGRLPRPGSAGDSRSLLLLLTAGENIVSFDDDVVCEPWGVARRSTRLVVTGHEERRRIRFFHDRASAFDAAPRIDEDLLGAHEALLGRSLNDLIDRSRPRADLSDACTHVRARLKTGEPQSVAVTVTGLAGDAAIHCPGRLLLASGRSRDELWSSEHVFKTAMTRREVHRIANAPFVTHTCHAMTYCAGLSNRQLLPPFPRIGRNEDGVFALLLSLSRPSALFGHLPVGVLHDSHRPSAFEPAGQIRSPWLGAVRSASESRMADFLIALLLRIAPSIVRGTPAERMRRVGAAVVTEAARRPRAFTALVRETLTAHRTSEFTHAERALLDEACPANWAVALNAYRTRYRRASKDPAFFLPIEFHHVGSLTKGFEALRVYVSEYGRLVARWPETWDTARALNVRSAREI